MIIIVFHYYNIYTLLCASTSCLISHDARIIPSSTERSCITIEHSYYINNSDHLLNRKYAVLIDSRDTRPAINAGREPMLCVVEKPRNSL